MNYASNREELRRLLKNLSDLLVNDNYHPGLMSWQELYRRALMELKDWVNS